MLCRRDWLLAVIAGVLALAVYAWTLAPTVTGEDSGELVAASYLGGVAHPPGYPLWCLVTGPFFWLPAGDMAWRANLASAWWAALTVAGMFLLARRWGIGLAGAWFCSLCLAFSQRFWSQSVIAEVYTLNALLLVGVLHAAQSVARYGAAASMPESPTDQERRNLSHARHALLALGLLFGLSLTNHYMLMLLVAPGVAMLLVSVWRFLLRNWKMLVLASGLGVASLLIYVYLPLAASRNPFVNWGNPDNLTRMWEHIARTSYRDLEFATVVTSSTKLLFLGHLASELWHQFTPWLLVFAAVGVVVLWKQDSWRFLSSTAVFVLNTVVLIFILRFTFERENRQRVEVYYLPAYMMVSLWLGFGADQLLAFLARRCAEAAHEHRRRFGLSGAATALIMLLPLVPLASNWHENNRRDFTLAREYAEGILRSADDHAIIFPSADCTTFPLLYLMGVEGQRPDILIGDKYGSIENEVHELFQKLRPRVRRSTKAEIMRVLVADSGRPVFVTDHVVLPPDSGCALVPWGLLYRVVARGQKLPAPPDIWERILEVESHTQDGLPKHHASPLILQEQALAVSARSWDPMERSLASGVYRMQAEFCLSIGQRQEGMRDLHLAADAVADDHCGLNNLGSIAAEYGETSLSCKLFSQALRVWPAYITPHVNLAGIAIGDGRLDDAAAHLSRAEAIDPKHDKVLRVRERLDEARRKATGRTPAKADERRDRAEAQEDLQERIRRLSQELAKSPEDPVLHNDLGTAYIHAGNVEKALEHWNLAVIFRPDYALAHRNLAICYGKELKDLARALEHRREYERLSGKDNKEEERVEEPDRDLLPPDPRDIKFPELPKIPQPPKAPMPRDPREDLPHLGN